MGTSIYVDTLKASESIKDFNKVLQNTKSEWKTLASAEKGAGNSLGALQAKYTGLGKEITQTREKISKLKEQQSKLNEANGGAIKKYNEYQSTINKLQEKQGKLDTSTKEGREEYERLGKQIDDTKKAQSENTGVTEKQARQYVSLDNQIKKAETQVSSYERQQKKAKSQMEYYTSGLAKLQKEHKLNTASSRAYVERLQAEGKTAQANKAKMAGLKDSLSNLNKQYDKQEAELKQIEKASGKSSEAYKKQKIRLDQTGKAIAENKTDMKGLQSVINKTSANPFRRLAERIKGTNKEAKKTHSLFKSIFNANIASNAISSAFMAIRTHMGDAMRMGNDYLEQQDKMSAQWKTLTGSVKGSKEMTNAINELATSAQNSAEMVNGLAGQFYAVSKNKDKVIELSKATLTLQDAFGATDDEIQNFGKQWSQMMANGKVSSQDFMSFTDVFPALKPALLDYEKDVTHNSKLTTEQLNDMISQGKISSETMNKVLTETAKKNSKATENFGKTIPGMTRAITNTMPELMGAIEKPFYKMKNPLVGSISKWVTDKNTTKEFDKLGKALTKTINEFTSAFGGKKLDAGKLLDKMLKGLTNSIKELGKWASKHKGTIKKFFGNFKAKTADTIKIIGATMSSFSKVVTPLIKLMAKHPKIAGTFLAGFMVAGKLKGTVEVIGLLASGITKVAKAEKVQAVAQKVMNAAMNANPIMKLVAVIGALIAGFVALYKHNKKFRKFINGLIDGAKKLAKSFGKWFGKTWKSVSKGASGAVKRIKKVFKPVGRFFSGIWRGIKKGAKAGWNGIKAVVGFGAKAVKAVALAPIVVLASIIVAVWNKIKKPTKKFWNWMKSTIGGIAKSIRNTVKKWFNSLKNAVSSIWNSIKKITRKVWNPIKKFVVNVAKAIHKGVTKTFNALKKGISKVWTGVKNVTHKVWNPLHKWLGNKAKAIGSSVKGKFNTLKNNISSIWGSVKNKTHKVWNPLHTWLGKKSGAIGSTVKGKFNTLKGNLSDIMSSISKGWHKTWNGMKDFFKDIWKSIKKHAKNGINGVVGFLNGGIGGINSVIHTFGGKKNAISKIKKLKNGGSAKGLAMVNDGAGEEAIIKHGQAYKVKGKNALVNLEGDETVVPHEASRSMFGDSIAHYKKGTKNWFSSLTGWVKDKWDGIVNFIKHPIKSLKSIMKNAMGKIKGSEFITKFTPPMKTGFIQGIWQRFKSMLQDLKTAHDDEGGSFDGKMGAHGVYAYLWNIAKKAMNKFGMKFTSGYRPGDRYYHGKHQAVDIAFGAGMNHSSRYFAPANWIFDHFKKQIGYVITQGKIKTRGKFNHLGSNPNGWSTWMDHDHYDHLHINGMWGPGDIAKGGGKVTGSHKNWLKQAGFRAGEIGAANWLVQHESGWRTKARNSGSGAYGLAQALPPSKYASAGSDWRTNPLTQLKWMKGYIRGRYGTANKAKAFWLSHSPHWYANGGIVDQEQLAHIAEGNQPEAIIPLSRLKRTQATQVLDQVRQRFTSEDGTGQNYDKELEAQIKELTDTVSSLKDLVAMILNVNSSTLQATKDGAFDKTKQYQQQARDMNLASYQGF